MSNKHDRRLLRDDLIDDMIEPPILSSTLNNPAASSFFIDSAKITQNRNYPSYPLVFNKPKFEQTDSSIKTIKNDQRDRSQIKSSSRIIPSSLLISNDERRKEIDRIIKNLYDGKLLTANNDDLSLSDNSESQIHSLSRGATTFSATTTAATTTTTAVKTDEESKNNELLTLDSDVTSLQRELKEKELDIGHLHKEIQELQLENKLLKAKGPSVYSNGYTNNNNETEVHHRREKNDLSIPPQNLIINRSNRNDDIHIHQKEVYENKLKSYEKQMRILVNENDKLKQNAHQTERILQQMKRENEELQKKVTEVKKRNDELFYQEFHSLRNNLKVLKERNNELFQENFRLQQEQQNIIWRSTLHEQQSIPSLKTSHSDLKHIKLARDESPYLSEGSDSTNYLTTVNAADPYTTRPTTSTYRSATIDGNNHHRTTRYNSSTAQEEINRNINSIPSSKSFDQPLNFRSSKTKHMTEWNEQNIRNNEDIKNYDEHYPTKDNTKSISLSSSRVFQSEYSNNRTATSNDSRHGSRRPSNNSHDDRRQSRGNIPTISPRRPYAPLSINDIHVNDIIKFSRPGSKVSKGTVKYIGPLPDKKDQYLGLELDDDEESKHDGIFQDQRIFQCKPNKGVFVGFNKVIMAWSGQ
ncbi:unnamed protein product [Adineta steineri]|uniref:CAP-Gly domain-containing protein n=2 Tax=Adineta steineri TaxID=433720 RepID=A0A813Y470_9BILA|nr:unnamed protein product [Adineta steineri]CAF0894794.1 unnamed protein product [Adineta steineri]CAF0963859.1 unnamed protein product [Adineta steineri]